MIQGLLQNAIQPACAASGYCFHSLVALTTNTTTQPNITSHHNDLPLY